MTTPTQRQQQQATPHHRHHHHRHHEDVHKNDDGFLLAREEKEEVVPPEKEFRPSTRENSQYKWQKGGAVLGALEIPSEPTFYPQGPWKVLSCGNNKNDKNDWTANDDDKEALLQRALQQFQQLGLRDTFVSAATNFPVETSCCGLLVDHHQTIQSLVPHLNETWVKDANAKLAQVKAGTSNDKNNNHDIAVDCFVWKWNNISGSSQTLVLLIRFFDKTVKIRHET